MKTKLLIAIATTSVAVSSTATAQTAPLTKTIPVTFTGVVANDVTNEIRIRQPDGSYSAFQGPVPEYPYKKGDQVSLTFNVTVPTKEFYGPTSPYAGQVSADGIYRISVTAAPYNGGSIVGTASTPKVSPGSTTTTGGILASPNFGQPTNTTMVLVFDANTDTYKIDFTSQNFRSGAYQAPGYTYDATSGIMTACNVGRCSPTAEDNNIFSLVGTATTLATGNIGIYGTAAGTGPAFGNRAGLYNINFEGSWNLASYSAASAVPAPGMAIAFGVGALAIMRRRRRKAG